MTTVHEISSLVDQYRVWLKDRTTLKALNAQWVEITTPFLDRHNDYIQLYAKSNNDSYVLTDDGHTLRDLEISGCDLSTPKRKKMLAAALNGFGVDQVDGTLSVRASRDNFPARKHALIEAILSVNDLFYTASATVRSLFKEDVARWMDLSEIRYLQNVQFVGKSHYTHDFDFAIPRSKSAPERLIRAISNPNKDAARSFMFSWLDTRDVREPDTIAFAVLNDTERVVPGAVTDALHSYEIQSILWSQRDANRDKLAM